MSEAAITVDSIINDVVNRFPQTVQVFTAAGMDICCGGALSIGEAAGRHRVDPNDLLKSIARAVANAACTLY